MRYYKQAGDPSLVAGNEVKLVCGCLQPRHICNVPPCPTTATHSFATLASFLGRPGSVQWKWTVFIVYALSLKTELVNIFWEIKSLTVSLISLIDFWLKYEKSYTSKFFLDKSLSILRNCKLIQKKNLFRKWFPWANGNLSYKKKYLFMAYFRGCKKNKIKNNKRWMEDKRVLQHRWSLNSFRFPAWRILKALAFILFPTPLLLHFAHHNTLAAHSHPKHSCSHTHTLAHTWAARFIHNLCQKHIGLDSLHHQPAPLALSAASISDPKRFPFL